MGRIPSARAGVRHVRYRVLLIIGVVALCLWALYPPRDRIKLGLDLNGGVQLVLRVDTNAAVRAHPDAARNERAAAQLRDETVQEALEIVERRINELGVAEPVIARYTQADQILVQLPGVSDVDAAKQIIRSTAQLRLTLVDKGPFASREAALAAYSNGVPDDLELLPGRAHGSAAEGLFYVVRRAAAVNGNDVRDARPSRDEFDRPAVAFSLKQDARERFAAFTARNIGRPMATVLDGRVTAVATIISRIDGDGQIVGVSREEMLEQAITFKSGALPADLEYVEERTVGASLGKASARAGLLASVSALAFVVLFMVAYYKRTGLNALVSIAVNLLILLGVVACIPIPMTLPGIAGLILTIGMGVDSNVLIFERIKEELAAGRTVREAVRAGFDRVWITIVDTHVSSLIAAAFLFQFGTSPIRGFATTLAIGLLANVFTAVFVSRTMFMLRAARRQAPDTLSIGWRLPRILKSDIDFGRWRRHALVLSVLAILAGAGAMATRGIPLGIDFSGGALVVVRFSQPGVTEDAVRAAVASLPGDEVVQQYGGADERQFLIRVPLSSTATGGEALDAQAKQVAGALRDAALPSFDVVSRELVSAAIGADLQRRGVYATLASIAAVSGYIATRFRMSFAVGAMAATLHDILVTLGCLAIAGYDLSLTVTAALLTITGYSVNDTIVIFDRVREMLKTGRREPVARVVNQSVNQTLSRTLITAGTTFLAALALYLFGGDALEGFAFTMLVGIVSGTYSTVFIASAIVIVLSGRERRAPAAVSAPSQP